MNASTNATKTTKKTAAEKVKTDPRAGALGKLAAMAALDEFLHRGPRVAVHRAPGGQVRVIGPEFGPIVVSPERWARAVHRRRLPAAASLDLCRVVLDARLSAEDLAALRLGEWATTQAVTQIAPALGHVLAIGGQPPADGSDSMSWAVVVDAHGGLLLVEAADGGAVRVKAVGRLNMDGSVTPRSPDIAEPAYGYRGVGRVHNPDHERERATGTSKAVAS